MVSVSLYAYINICNYIIYISLSSLRLLKNNFLLVDLPVTLKQKFPGSLHRRFGILILCLGDQDQL